MSINKNADSLPLPLDWGLGGPIDAPVLELPRRTRGSSARRDTFRTLDARPGRAIDIITYAFPGTSGRYGRPDLYIGSDGLRYWVKARAQRGLVAEVIAGRLADSLGVGPIARVARLDGTVAPLASRLYKFSGLAAASQDVADTMNQAELLRLVQQERLVGARLDSRSRAAVTAFQTWIGVSDEQVLVRLTDGKVLSIDHGDAFGELLEGPPSRIVLAGIPGVSDNVGRDWDDLRPAVEAIEALPIENIYAATAGIPDGDRWLGSSERRYQIANWLVVRQRSIGEEIRKWARLLS